MTMMGTPGRRTSDVGEKVASFPTYEGAQKAVSQLIQADVPARDIAIVGQGLRSVERITGRLGYATAARSGAVNGILLGLLFSAIFVLGNPTAGVAAFLGVMLVGIALGMLMSIVMYSIVRRRRDYASVMQVVADHYEVNVARDSLGKARGVLGSRATAPAAPAAAPDLSEPPRYGERITPGATAPVPPAGDAPAGPSLPEAPTGAPIDPAPGDVAPPAAEPG
ncbi:general stress protein [uncultured Microbacterium sp.]|uniref:general stress protein n=1 Tax=uncultured Microbacterium sp. TaxID=191216 RepID=UPI0025E23E76|nr:general stress protein [uncultured Microbacterium sp.]